MTSFQKPEYQVLLGRLSKGIEVPKNLQLLHNMLLSSNEAPPQELQNILFKLTTDTSVNEAAQDSLLSFISYMLSRGTVILQLFEYLVIKADSCKNERYRTVVWNSLGKTHSEQKISHKAVVDLLSAFDNSSNTSPSKREIVIHLILLLTRNDLQLGADIIKLTFEILSLEISNSSICRKITEIIALNGHKEEKHMAACSKILLECIITEKKSHSIIELFRSTANSCPLLFANIIFLLDSKPFSNLLNLELLECIAYVLLQGGWKDSLRDQVVSILLRQETLNSEIKNLLDVELFLLKGNKPTVFKNAHYLLQIVKNGAKLTFRASNSLEQALLSQIDGREKLIPLIIEVFGAATHNQRLQSSVAFNLCTLFVNASIELSQNFLKIMECSELKPNSLSALVKRTLDCSIHDKDEKAKLLALDLIALLSVKYSYLFQDLELINISIAYLKANDSCPLSFLKKTLPKVLTIFEDSVERSNRCLPVEAMDSLFEVGFFLKPDDNSLPRIVELGGHQKINLLGQKSDLLDHTLEMLKKKISSKEAEKVQVSTSKNEFNHTGNEEEEKKNSTDGFKQKETINHNSRKEKNEGCTSINQILIQEFFYFELQQKELADFKVLLDKVLYKPKDVLKWITETEFKAKKARCLCLLLEGITLGLVSPWKNSFSSDLCEILPNFKNLEEKINDFEDLESQIEFIKLMLLVSELDDKDEVTNHILTRICSITDSSSWCREITYFLLHNLVSWEEESDFSLIALAIDALEVHNGYHENHYLRDRLFVLLLRRLLWDEKQYTVLQLQGILLFLKLGATNAETHLLTSQDQNWVSELRQSWIISHLSSSWSIEEKFIFLEALNQLAWSPSCCQVFFDSMQEADANEVFEILNLVAKHEISELKFEDLISNIRPEAKNLREMRQSLLVLILEEAVQQQSISRTYWRELIMNCNWTLENSLSLLEAIKDQAKEKEVKAYIPEVLKLIVEYKICWKYEIEEIIQSKAIKDWEIEIFTKATFQDNPLEKNLQAVLEELKSSNNIVGFFERLKEDYSAVIQQSERAKDPINNWNKERIQEWSRKFDKTSTSISEVLAVVRRASSVQCGRQLRITQLIAIIMFWRGKNNTTKKGRLAQIPTGDGKSLTIAALAVVFALYGSRIDIITSSYQLAQRDQAEWSDFYRLFGFEASHNCDAKNSGEDGGSACYNSHVVYGDAGSFQSDYLKQVYYGRETRGSRPFDVVIVDEVDNMLLDEGSKSTLLSSPCPGFGFMQPLLVAVWHQLHEIEDRFFFDDEGNLSWSTNKPGAEFAEDKETYPVDDRDEFLKKTLVTYMQHLIQNAGSEVYVPSHLQQFASKQIETWVDSAVKAVHMREHRDYVITQMKDGRKEVAPVDFQLTGVVQVGMIWQSGLHQFIQMKHSIEITSESLSSCFISNVTFFNKYTQLFGLTGTLGSPESQKSLAESYSIDIFIMPTYKPRQFIELPLRSTDSKKAWHEAICAAVTKELSRKRSILILCQTIEDASELREILLLIVDKGKCSNYERDDVDGNKIETLQMSSGQVLIATNLAGRGVDLKIPHVVEENGGLHVILTFLPSNLRVEMQAFGRTARQGKKGSGQIIIDAKATFEGFEAIPADEDAKDIRDMIDSVRLSQVLTVELPQTLLKDRLFEKYIDLYCDLKGKGKKRRDYIVDAAEERWAIWLKCIETDLLKKTADKEGSLSSNSELEKAVFKQFDVFAQEIKESFPSKKHVKNPLYFILAGIQIMGRKEYASSIDNFNSALSYGDSVYAFGAYYNRAYARIRGKVDDYKTLACEDLKATKKHIENSIIPGLESMMALLSRCPKIIPVEEQKKEDNDQKDSNEEEDNGSCINQILIKINLLRNCVNSIDKAVSIIQKCKKDSEIVIKSSVHIADMKDELKISESNLSEIRLLGLQMFFEVEEKPPVSWWGIIALGLLAVVQIVAGAFLTVFGAPNFGLALLGEGISDAYHALSSAIKGESIDWNEYGIQKSISLAVSVATMGWGAVKQGCALIKRGAQKMFAKVANKTLAKEGVSQSTKEGLKLSTKLIAKEALIFGGKIGLDKGFEALASKIMNDLIKEFKDLLSSSLKERLSNGKFKELAKKILALSSIPKSTEGKIKIQEVVENIIYEQEGMFSSICSRLVGGIGGALKGASKAVFTLAHIGIGLQEAGQMSDKIAARLEKDIEKCSNKFWSEKTEHWKIELNKITSNSKETTSLISNLSYGRILTRQNIESCISDKRIHKQVFEFAENKINKAFEFTDEIELNELFNFIIECFLDKLSTTVQAKVLSPCYQAASGKLVKYVRGKTTKLDDQVKTYGTARTLNRLQNKIANNTKASNPPRNTNTKANDGTEHQSPELKKLLDSTLTNGEGGLEHLGALSAHAGRRIEVYKNGKRYTSVGDQKGEPIRLDYQPPQPGRRGHWSPLDQNLKPTVSGAENCLYDAVGSITNTPGQQMRNVTAQHIQRHPDAYHRVSNLVQQLSGTNYLLYGAGKGIRSTLRGPIKDNRGNIARQPTKKEKEMLPELAAKLKAEDLYNNGCTRTIIPRGQSNPRGERIDMQMDNPGYLNLQYQVGSDSLAKVRIPVEVVAKDKNAALRSAVSGLQKSIDKKRECHMFLNKRGLYPTTRAKQGKSKGSRDSRH